MKPSVGADAHIGPPYRATCYTPASGGALSVTSDRKYPKNATKTNGFGILARSWCGKCRKSSPSRIKRRKSVPCFRIVPASIHRDALRACAARPSRAALCVYRAARCGHRALRSSIGKPSVGAGVPDGPPPVNPRTLKNSPFSPILFQLSSPPLAPRPTL